LKILTALGAISALGAGYALAHGESHMYAPGAAVFAAKGSETQKITIGGNITTQYQFVDVNDEIDNQCNPEQYNNFLMAHIRLSVKAEIGEGWSGYMNIDFAGKEITKFEKHVDNAPTEVGREIDSCCDCQDRCKLFVDKAYIQKVWLDATFRAGYQKVNWGAEQNTPEPHLKTIERSVATNFFANLGRRANTGSAGNAVTNTNKNDNFAYVGEGLGGRHTGVFVAGQWNAFHYSGAIVSGHSGLCMNSDEFNNELGFYSSLAFEFGIDEIDFLIGVNGGFKSKGSNERATVNRNVYGVNPYVFANWNQLSFMGEMFWGSVENGSVCGKNNIHGDADPWGFNAIASYMCKVCF